MWRLAQSLAQARPALLRAGRRWLGTSPAPAAERAAYHDLWRRSLEEPERFWGAAARRIDWARAPQRIYDDRPEVDDAGVAGPAHWFADGRLNMAYNAVDRHVEQGHGARAALIYDSPVTSTVRTLSFAELQQRVSECAGALAALGVEKGDRVVLYMPMIPETVITMLACARLGAVHCVVFGGFAAHELAVRINDVCPKVVVYASCGIEGAKVIPYKPLVDQALAQTRQQPQHRVVFQRPQLRTTPEPGEHDWSAITQRTKRRPLGE